MAGKKFALKAEKVRSNVGGVLPELVDYQGRTWTVVEGDEVVIDHRRLTITVPVGSHRRGDRLRALARLRISPPTPDWAAKIADPQMIEAMEAVRAHKAVDAAGLGYDGDSTDADFEYEEQRHSRLQDQLTGFMRKGDLRNAMKVQLQATAEGNSIHLDCEQYTDSLRYDEYDEDGVVANAEKTQADIEAADFVRYRDALNRLIDKDDYRTSVAAAKMIEDLPTIRKPGQGRPVSGDAQTYEELVEQSNTIRDPREGRRGDSGEAMADKAKAAFDEALKEAMKEFAVGGGGDVGYEGVGKPFDGDGSQVKGGDALRDIPWNTVTWVKPPLVRNLLLHKSARRKRSTDEGAVIKNMHRWYTDRRIFERKRRVHGGTLMVDCSGSMSLTASQIDDLIEVSPHATVVLYSGNHRGGNLVLVAKKGKRCLDEDVTAHNFGGNEIDGPALQWLAKQEEPRVWVSDGMACVTGWDGWDGNDNGGLTDCVAWCSQFAKKNSIVRMPTFDKAIELLRRLW